MASTIYTDLLDAYLEIKDVILPTKADKADERGAVALAITADKAVRGATLLEDGTYKEDELSIPETYETISNVDLVREDVAMNAENIANNRDEFVAFVDGPYSEFVSKTEAEQAEQDSRLDALEEETQRLDEVKIDDTAANERFALLRHYPDLEDDKTILDLLEETQSGLNAGIEKNASDIADLQILVANAREDIDSNTVRIENLETNVANNAEAIGANSAKFDEYTPTKELEFKYLTKEDADNKFLTVADADNSVAGLSKQIGDLDKKVDTNIDRLDKALQTEANTRKTADDAIESKLDKLSSEYKSFATSTTEELKKATSGVDEVLAEVEQKYVPRSAFEGENYGIKNAYGFATVPWIESTLDSYLTRKDANATFISVTQAAEIYVTKASLDKLAEDLALKISKEVEGVTDSELKVILKDYATVAQLNNATYDMATQNWVKNQQYVGRSEFTTSTTAIESKIDNLKELIDDFATQSFVIEKIGECQQMCANNISAVVTNVAANSTAIGKLDTRVAALETLPEQVEKTVDRVEMLEDDFNHLEMKTSEHTAEIHQISNMIRDLQGGVITDFVGVNVNIEQDEEGAGGDLSVDGEISCSKIRIGNTVLDEAKVKTLIKLINNWPAIEELLGAVDQFVVKEDIADMATKSDLDEYLPLSGGTLTGDLKVNTDITTLGTIYFDTAKTKSIKVE